MQLAHRFLISDYPIARSHWSMTRLSNRALARAVRRIVIDIERGNESPLAICARGHSHGLLDSRFACGHFVRSRRGPNRMPPCHRDSPLSHGAFRVLLGRGSETSPRFFIKERVQQRHAAREFWLGGWCARYREVHFPRSAQIARFRDGRAADANVAKSAD